jgi:hypothetical protein
VDESQVIYQNCINCRGDLRSNVFKANLRTGEEEAASYFTVVFRDSNRGTDEDQEEL